MNDDEPKFTFKIEPSAADAYWRDVIGSARYLVVTPDPVWCYHKAIIAIARDAITWEGQPKRLTGGEGVPRPNFHLPLTRR